jgi:hypothetical protein
MLVRRFTRLKLGAILATSFVVGMPPGPGHAYTDEEQQACAGDAFRLCSLDIPDVDRVTACMIRNKSQLSPGCRAFFGPGPQPDAAADAGAPVDIKPMAPRKSHAKPHKIRQSAKPSAT